jgi:GMP synthase-like glutamine amidotransferase
MIQLGRWNRFGNLLRLGDHGFVLDVRHTWDKSDLAHAKPHQRLPEEVNGYQAVVIGAGPGDAVDATLDAEVALVQEAHRQGIPVLGMCLGSQVVARALGAAVLPIEEFASGERDPIWTYVELTEAGRQHPLFDGVDPLVPTRLKNVMRWELPAGAVRLATAEENDNQAFALGLTVGIQFHVDHTEQRRQAIIAVHRRNNTIPIEDMESYAVGVRRMERPARRITANFASIVERRWDLSHFVRPSAELPQFRYEGPLLA